MRIPSYEIEKLCRSLKPVIGEQAEALWLAYLAEDEDGKLEFEQVLPLLAAKVLNKTLDDNKVLLSPPGREVAHGEFPIGNVVYNGKELYPLGLREEDFIKQIGIFSITGAGKSNLGMLLALQLLRRGIPWMIIDWRRQYRNLLSLHAEQYPELKQIRIFTLGRNVSPFSWNPFRGPPNVHYKSWLSIIAEILERSHLSGPGVADFFLKAYDQVAEREGLPNAETGMQPNFFDGLRELEQMKAAGREFLWKQSCGRILRSFTYGPLAAFFNARHPDIKLEELLEKPVILELDVEMPQWMRVFVTELILRFIHLWRLSKGDSRRLRHVLVLEEVHNLFPKTFGQRVTSNLESVYREIRGTGQGLVSVTQHTSLLPIYILGNCQVQITLALQHGDDIDASSKSLFLDIKDAVYLDRTKVGEGIVKIKGRVNPCLVKFPLVPVKIGQVDDDFVRRHMAGYFTYFSRNNPKRGDITLISAQDNILAEQERNLLLDVLSFPLCAVSTRYKHLGLNPRQGTSLKDSLISKGYLAAQTIFTGQGRVVVLELTPKSRTFLRDAGHKVPDQDRQESIEHVFWKGRVAHYYRQRGFEVEVEKYINGRPDVIVRKGEVSAAVEIETGKSDPISNVLRNLKHDFTEIIIAATSDAVEKAIAAKLQAANLAQDGRIRVVSVKAF